MRFKARRGAVVVMLGIMIVTLVSVSAIAIDFSRLWALRNELQTSADAGAHAGAIQLGPPNNAGTTVAVATTYATLNLAMAGTVTVDSVVLGDWDDIGKTFTPGAAVTDAVSVVVSRPSSGLIMSMLGVAPPRLKARAIGWADAPVANATGCIKPVAVPMTQLMWRLNVARGIANTPDTAGMYRPFDQVNDMAALSNMPVADRTFSLKIGAGQTTDTLGQMGGNYQAVKLGKYWDKATGAYAVPPPNNGGANAYRDHMAGLDCNTLSVGDSLITEPGNMTTPTVCGVIGNPACNSANGPGICASLPGATDNTQNTDPTFGNCMNASGTTGVDVKAAFYRCMSSCSGKSTVEVTMMGSFTLMKVYPDKSKNNTTPVFEKAEIVGIFHPVGDPGSIGPGATMYTRPILVK